MQRWPEFFLTGDPWLGLNLSAESEYSRIKSMVFRKSQTFFRAAKATKGHAYLVRPIMR